jgi:hypothetical protein
MAHWISASLDDGPLPDQPIFPFPCSINGTISGATTLIILIRGLTAGSAVSWYESPTVHLYRQLYAFLNPRRRACFPRGAILWLSGHIATGVAALPGAGANHEGRGEPGSGNEKCAQRAHFSKRQNSGSLFRLVGLDAKRKIGRAKAEDGGQQDDETDNACRHHPVFSPRQIRHRVTNQSDPDHCANNTINTTDVFCHASSLWIK